MAIGAVLEKNNQAIHTFSSVPILIPAYNPDFKLISLLKSLSQLEFSNIIVVNDGSKKECNLIFEEVQKFDNCELIVHKENMGKGRALKTGLEYCKTHLSFIRGVVTADADGQHRVEDIVNVAKQLVNNSNSLILGSRDFKKDVPFRSLLGNTLTKYVFALVAGKRITDTQTGLRGIPFSAFNELIEVKGERYEYEINMLLYAANHNIKIVEQPIATVYIENNKSSHFNPIIDSMKIYLVLLRFGISSLITSVIDYIAFTICYLLFGHLLASFVGARIVASIFNFFVNKKIVFQDHGKTSGTFFRYYAVLIIMTSCSYLVANYLSQSDFFSGNVFIAKIVSESALFIVSFMLQRYLVYLRKPSN